MRCYIAWWTLLIAWAIFVGSEDIYAHIAGRAFWPITGQP